ncbi:Radical SAM domain protein [Ferroglobus placidus DSM 10642]|uniref:Radical SAM domain protein n=1 Tax=Ferroglobus placidus (strain DSM 10642 / AEDII12DO) TaxID=589924 RepID=D3RZU8_FERPA|nr:radical SAM protein [Ferroglobus placidus]ADC66011.1 Radical SAM domain protein [Ferroglobus placidus DSM 10642]
MDKEKILKKLEEDLSEEEIEKAKRNDHARRKPRACGFTVHIAKGCNANCLYCYVSTKAKLVDLSPKALLYALLLNPKFEVGKSFVAVGAICEPLDFPEYTKEFLREIIKLGNPVQISTKEVNYDLAKLLKRVDALVSMCSAIDDICKKFEPKRKPPSERLEFCEEIGGAVFLRPILPNVSLKDYFKSLEIISNYTDRVILGNLRLSKEVKRKLGIKELPKKYFEVKKKLEDYAKDLGLIVYRSACCSNAYKHKVVCWNECWKKGFCSSCPNTCWVKV